MLLDGLLQELVLPFLPRMHSRDDYFASFTCPSICIPASLSLLEEAVLQIARPLYTLHNSSNNGS